MKRKSLIVVHTNTWFTEMNRVADLVIKSEIFSPHVHFAYAYPTVDNDIQKLIEKKISFSTAWKQRPDIISTGVLAKILRVSNYYLERIFKIRKIWGFVSRRAQPLTAPFSSLQKSRQEILQYKKLIADVDACLVVMGGDLVGYNTPEIVRAAREMNRACVIVPSTMSDGTEQAEAYFFDSNFSLEKPFNRFAGWLWPKWKKLHKGKWLVRVPALQIFARQWLCTDPPLPWVSSSTRADAIAVESEAMRDYYLRCGIDQKYLFETGSLANDKMAIILKNKDWHKSDLIRNLNLDIKKKVILTALPPDSLYMKGGRPECEFKSYEELTRFWVRSLAAANNFNVVISLHPSVDRSDFLYLESENVRISTLPIVDLIPLCDVFVASVSSTIRWSITCAKPVINYDVYHYGYADFKAVKGVVLLEKAADFIKTLAQINDETSGYLAFLNQEIESQASYWGNLDGLEGKRILDLFEREMKKKTL